MNEAIRRAADAQIGTKHRAYQLTDRGWNGPTITPQEGERPPLVDCSTWQCPHDPHCGHYTPCLRRHRTQLEQARRTG